MCLENGQWLLYFLYSTCSDAITMYIAKAGMFGGGEVWLIGLHPAFGKTVGNNSHHNFRDGTIQGSEVSMHHSKNITIPRYITTLEHFISQV